jgi:hypothetical protein
MRGQELSRWPFRLAATSPLVLVGGLAALLVTLADMTDPQTRYRAVFWQFTVLKAVPFLAGALALTGVGASIRSLVRYPSARTCVNLCSVGVASLSLLLVFAMANNWTLIENALGTFTDDGGWAAIRSRPSAAIIAGIVTSANGPLHAYPYVDSAVIRNGAITAPDGCFAVRNSNATKFGVLSRGYQTLMSPVGNGYFHALVNLSPLGATEPSKVTWQRISILEFLKQENACLGRLGTGH